MEENNIIEQKSDLKLINKILFLCSLVITPFTVFITLLYMANPFAHLNDDYEYIYLYSILILVGAFLSNTKRFSYVKYIGAVLMFGGLTFMVYTIFII